MQLQCTKVINFTNFTLISFRFQLLESKVFYPKLFYLPFDQNCYSYYFQSSKGRKVSDKLIRT